MSLEQLTKKLETLKGKQSDNSDSIKYHEDASRELRTQNNRLSEDISYQQKLIDRELTRLGLAPRFS